MNNSRKKYFLQKKDRDKQWLQLALLSPLLILSGWVAYYSFILLLRWFHDFNFGHGSEVLIAFPFAMICIWFGVKLIRKLIFKKNDDSVEP